MYFDPNEVPFSPNVDMKLFQWRGHYWKVSKILGFIPKGYVRLFNMLRVQLIKVSLANWGLIINNLRLQIPNWPLLALNMLWVWQDCYCFVGKTGRKKYWQPTVKLLDKRSSKFLYYPPPIPTHHFYDL